MTLTPAELADVEEALEQCAILHRDGFVHGPGSHWPEHVFADMVPHALTVLAAARERVAQVPVARPDPTRVLHDPPRREDLPPRRRWLRGARR